MTSCNVGHEVNKVLSNDFVTVHDVYVCSYSNFFIIVTFRHYNFELWTEGKRIMQNMDLADALSAFLHLVFTFNLKYPQVCTHFELIVNQSFQCCFLKKAEYLCDFIQHVVAEYGDEDGTRTSKAKTTAENKRMRYYVQLGKALGMKTVRK